MMHENGILNLTRLQKLDDSIPDEGMFDKKEDENDDLPY